MLLIPPLASSDRIVRPWRQLLLCAMAVLVASCLPGGEAWAQTPPTTAADYARRPMLSDFNVAPSNRHAAFLLVNDKGRQVAGVIDLEKPSDVKVVAAYADANVTSVRWINDRRLVYEAYQPGALIDPGGAGTFAVDLDGERRQQLISWVNNNESTGTHIRSRVLTYGWHVWRSWDGRGDDVLAYRNVPSGIGDRAGRQLVRLDSIHGTYRNLSFDQPPFADTWGFDAQGELRLIGATRNGREKLFLRASGQSEWAEIEDEAELSDRPLQPLYIEGDGTVIVLSRRGRDTLAMHTYDPKSRVLGADALAAASSYDIGTDFETDGQARLVVGVHLQADRLRSVWFDEGLVAAQRTVDEALPKDRFNRLLCGNCLSAQRFVVRSSSDRISAEYFVYDRQKRSLVRIGTERPWLPEASQGRRTFHRVAARDGLSLPVVITHPSGRETDKNLPAVVLVHGGPWVRGTDLSWSDEAQFLASRGYRVLEVDFRGSTGLGSKHFQAGWKQW
ncbi:MAG: hypothetical protein Q8R98_25905, partial [Rubrivivax sp.]|nr:hypothetical protein [Rubrivivax sp.]